MAYNKDYDARKDAKIPAHVRRYLPKDGRTRAWAFVMYPESMPDDWADIIGNTRSRALLSPLHDKDKNADGTAKKAHYHLEVMTKNKRSYAQAKKLAELLHAPDPEPVSDMNAYARYLCHMDNPEKYQYDASEVKEFGGADYLSMIGTASDRYRIFHEIIQFCRAQGITSFAVLADYAEQHNEEWFRAMLDSGTYFLKAYMRAMEYDARSPYGGTRVTQDDRTE